MTAPYRNQPSFLAIALKASVVHTVTYSIMGILAYSLLDYSGKYADPNVRNFMRQTTDLWVMIGPLFQPIRGFLFGIAFYLLRDSLFGRRRGWLVMWAVLMIVGVLSTFGPAPSSIEGMLYTILPLSFHLVGLPEVVLQTLLLAVILCYWVDHPERSWLTWVMILVFVVVMTFPILGLLANSGGIGGDHDRRLALRPDSGRPLRPGVGRRVGHAGPLSTGSNLAALRRLDRSPAARPPRSHRACRAACPARHRRHGTGLCAGRSHHGRWPRHRRRGGPAVVQWYDQVGGEACPYVGPSTRRAVQAISGAPICR